MATKTTTKVKEEEIEDSSQEEGVSRTYFVLGRGLVIAASLEEAVKLEVTENTEVGDGN